MSYFKAKMHQIQFRLGLCPSPCWGSLQRFPRPLAGFKGPTSKVRGEKREREGWEAFPLLVSVDLTPMMKTVLHTACTYNSCATDVLCYVSNPVKSSQSIHPSIHPSMYSKHYNRPQVLNLSQQEAVV